jgi:hypothetical protein
MVSAVRVHAQSSSCRRRRGCGTPGRASEPLLPQVKIEGLLVVREQLRIQEGRNPRPCGGLIDSLLMPVRFVFADGAFAGRLLG